MKRWGFIYMLGGTSAETRSDTLGSPECALVCRGVRSIGDAPGAARELVADGVELIDLCGAFSGAGLAAVVGAIEGSVPVGAVFYGAEAGTGLHKLFG